MEVTDITEHSDGSADLGLSLDEKEMTALIFAGMSEVTYNKDILITAPLEDIEKALPFENFQKACANNDVSVEDGFTYLQIGIQTALVQGIHLLMEQHEDVHNCLNAECGCGN